MGRKVKEPQVHEWTLLSGKVVHLKNIDINPESLEEIFLDYMSKGEAKFLVEQLYPIFPGIRDGQITVEGEAAFVKDDLELAFGVGEYLRNSGIQGFDDWFESEFLYNEEEENNEWKNSNVQPASTGEID